MITPAIMCLALNVYFEARSEPIAGQRAVAHVTLNRARERNMKVCDVVFEPAQFSWTAADPRVRNEKAWARSLAVAKRAYARGRAGDPTGGANHYHADYVRPREPRLGPMGATATEMAAHRRRTSGHYRPELDRAAINMESNAIASDGGTIEHGARVWALDHKGRVITGTAYYSLNNRWHVVSGRYGLTSVGTGEIFTRQPEFLRVKRNDRARRTTLERKMHAAAQAMDFRRAEAIKTVLFPQGPLFAIWSKSNKAYFGVMYSGYTPNIEAAGKYTRAELKPYLGAAMKTEDYRAVWIAPPGEELPF